MGDERLGVLEEKVVAGATIVAARIDIGVVAIGQDVGMAFPE
jgi:hypothetical protein